MPINAVEISTPSVFSKILEIIFLTRERWLNPLPAPRPAILFMRPWFRFSSSRFAEMLEIKDSSASAITPDYKSYVKLILRARHLNLAADEPYVL